MEREPRQAIARLLHLERRELWVVIPYLVGIGLLTLVGPGPVATKVLVSVVAFGSLLLLDEVLR